MNPDNKVKVFALLMLAYRVATLSVLAWIAIELNGIRSEMPSGSRWEIERIANDVDKIERHTKQFSEEGVRIHKEPPKWNPPVLPPLQLQ